MTYKKAFEKHHKKSNRIEYFLNIKTKTKKFLILKALKMIVIAKEKMDRCLKILNIYFSQIY